ncbi:MAG: hypothetical protein EZS28_033278 [Streblomastix strix]|uniref:Uncharacterized protein n=1 Tax=Streblomastix strix TaxID=222440 RepID=A0A5J4UKM4_9EUKA|nr:MAG: hypothetical protein EZS28_033278 [Streblomastix strix]
MIEEMRIKSIKDITDEDKLRLLTFDEAFKRLATLPIKDKNIKQPSSSEIIRTKRSYNKKKFRKVERETAQVEPQDVVKNSFQTDLNLEELKFVLDNIWANVISRKLDVDFLFSDNFIKFWKDHIRVMDVFIKNVSISVLDNVLWKRSERLYRISKDFVRLSDKSQSEIRREL